MRKIRVYIDTSVIGGCFDNEFLEGSNKLNEIPEDFIEKLSLISEVEELAQRYIDEKVISNNFAEDARHIALATINKIDVLASWNFKHIVNIKTQHRKLIRSLKYLWLFILCRFFS